MNKYKLKYPEKGEENIVYIIVNYNEQTGRAIIEPINMNFKIVPRELIQLNQLIKL